MDNRIARQAERSTSPVAFHRRRAGLAGSGPARSLVTIACALALGGCSLRGGPSSGPLVEDWIVSDLLDRTDPAVSILGDPSLVESPWGQAVAFDGRDDGIILSSNPLAGLSRFTIEVVMRPASDGPPAQRYLHFGQVDGERVLMETRVTPEGRWYHDSFVRSDTVGVMLMGPTLLHPGDVWYHVALVFDNGAFSTYVNGRRELEGNLTFSPQAEGNTSIGVRMNQTSWYKGAIRRIRITNRPLDPAQFLQPARPAASGSPAAPAVPDR